jgi:hypothetical protein
MPAAGLPGDGIEASLALIHEIGTLDDVSKLTRLICSA